jgi:uncharacterized Zn-binding protein involved in type VI secretion
MPQGLAARITDPVMHPLPPLLTPGPGSPTCLIGMLPAWRGVPAAAVPALQAASNAAQEAIQTAEAATAAAVGPAEPIAYTAQQTLEAALLVSVGALINAAAAASGADKHMCVTPFPVPPHGVGVVTTGSKTVMIDNLPACRMGDTIIEAIGPPNQIAMGCPTVTIGG